MPAAKFWNRGGHITAALMLCTLWSGCAPSAHDLVAGNKEDALRARLEARPTLIESRDRLGKTPLHHAVTYDRIALMPLLAEAGANLDEQDGTGMTPLHGAALLGKTEAARWLAEAGANLNARDAFGDTPFHTAAIFGRSSVLRVLAAHGAILDEVNAAGMTPLQAARHYGREEAASNVLRLIAWCRGRTPEERLEILQP